MARIVQTPARVHPSGSGFRLPVLLRWLDATKPDVACLQELKAPQEKIPEAAIRDAGYGAAWHGQKSWNGVAILVRDGEPADAQSRHIEATVRGIRVGCLYLPAGNPLPGPKFDYKLRWLDRLAARATELDVYNPARWLGDALFQPEVRDAFRRLVGEGWTDAFRTLHPDERIYTFYDYCRDAYGRGAGLRIDHLLLSPALAPRLAAVGVDHDVRGWEKSSDHVPTWIEVTETNP